MYKRVQRRTLLIDEILYSRIYVKNVLCGFVLGGGVETFRLDETEMEFDKIHAWLKTTWEMSNSCTTQDWLRLVCRLSQLVSPRGPRTTGQPDCYRNENEWKSCNSVSQVIAQIVWDRGHTWEDRLNELLGCENFGFSVDLDLTILVYIGQSNLNIYYFYVVC